MKAVFSTDETRIAPLLDVASQFVIVTASADGAYQRRIVNMPDFNLCGKVRRIVSMKADVLVCGAISRPLEAMIAASGIGVLPNTCGPLEDVIRAVFSGSLKEQNFLMPGCPGRQQRNRRRRQRWRFHE